MEFSRIEKSHESHQVQKVDGRENRKKGKSDEEFHRKLQEEREEREKEDKVEISDDEPAAAPAEETKTYRTTPRYRASDAATSLALLGLQLFTAKEAAEGEDDDGDESAEDGETDDASGETDGADDTTGGGGADEPDTAA